jgi:membrane associated rhomboid family serine protease
MVSPSYFKTKSRDDLNLPPAICDGFWSINTHNQRLLTHSDVLFASYFPLLIGPTCSENRRRDIARLFVTFFFYLIVAQFGFYIFLFYTNYSSLRTDEIDEEILRNYGAFSSKEIHESHQYSRFLSSIFMHGNLFHLFINIFFEFIFLLGREANWGFLRTIFIFFLSSICGSFYTLAFNKDFVIVGPSSGIFGVFAVFLVLFCILVDSFP